MKGTRAIGILSFIGLMNGCGTLESQTENAPAVDSVKNADYALAEKWLYKNASKLVKNIVVRPHWIANTDTFWYKRELLERGYEFTLVDAATGSKTPAFDHQKLASALNFLNVQDISAVTLPFSEFKYSSDRSEITFSARSIDYQCRVESTDCEIVSDPKPTSDDLLISPDGRWGLRTRSGNLWLVDIENGEERPLTADGEENFGYGIFYDNWKAGYIPRLQDNSHREHLPVATEWSPNSDMILTVRIDQRHVEPYPLINTAPHDGSFRPKLYTPRIPLTGEVPAKAEWFLIDVKNGHKVRLDLPYESLLHVHQDLLAIRSAWWYGNRIFLLAHGANMEGAYLFEVNIANGKVRVVVEEHTNPRTDLNTTSYNPPNVRVVSGGREAIWFSQRSGWGHLYLYDVESGALKNRITEGNWLVRDIVGIDEVKRRIYFTGAGKQGGDPYYRYLYRVNFDGTDLVLLSPEDADHMITAANNDIWINDGGIDSQVISPTGNYAVYNYSRINQPTRTAIRKVSDATLISIFEEADASALYAAGWQDPKAFIVKADDRETNIYGVMYMPYNFDPNKKYPVIDSQYASPLTAVVPHNFLTAIRGIPALVQPASLASLGFLSVIIDARGTTFRSRAFSHYSYGNLDTNGLEDHVAAIEQLAVRFTWIDQTRVGIHGYSYGGYSTYRAMFEFPEFFRVGVAVAGTYSIQSMYPDYHREAYQGRVLYENASHIRPNAADSPLNYGGLSGANEARSLDGNLLIMVGELDENVLPASTLQLIAKLIELDKDFEMVYFPGMSHALQNSHSIRRIWDFFVRNLLQKKPPTNYSIDW